MNKPTPKIYRTTNWSSYNCALINRGNLTIWFDPETQWYAKSKGKQGRNQTYFDTAIQCCLMIKSLFRLPFIHYSFLSVPEPNGYENLIVLSSTKFHLTVKHPEQEIIA